MYKNIFNITDIIIILLATFFSIWLYNLFWFDHSWNNNTSSVKADFLMVQFANNSAQHYPLHKDIKISIEGSMGESIIEIKQNRARFIHSPCRNQFCVLHGWLKHNNDITACLPNRISISLHSKNQLQHSQFDALSGSQ